MSATIDTPLEASRFQAVCSFYTAYMEVLDDERLSEWPEFFTEDCEYQIIPRENFDAGFQLCTIQADSRNMLLDRVQGILRTQRYGPRRCRRFYSGLRITGLDDEAMDVRQNVLLIQTLLDGSSQILLCGVAYDRVRIEQSRLRFKRRIVVADTDTIDNALILPL
jgi:3-phenylpropionate/cinnamic acid dioxygenase small subunit